MERTSTLGQPETGTLGLRDPSSKQRARDFGKSILLLGFALLAALYSNSVAREGRITAAGVAAGAALFVAGWVGLRLVPRLASAVEWSWVPMVAKYRITREGYIYIGALGVVTVAALNTSNNLLYMVLSALMAFLVLSAILSNINLRLVEVEVRLPARCTAKQPFAMEVLLNNRKQAFPSLSLRVEPSKASPFAFSSIYLPVLRRNEPVSRRVDVTLPRRGKYRLESIGVQSRYPFGFMNRDGTYRVSAECVAFPEILSDETLFNAGSDLLGSHSQLKRGQGIDLYMIRDYLPSDSARRVDWKASAKTSALKSREFAAEDSPRILLVFDRYGRNGNEEDFERLVSQAASYTVHLKRKGAQVRFVSDDWASQTISSEGDLEAVLHYLALVEMTDGSDAPTIHPEEPTLTFSLRSGARP